MIGALIRPVKASKKRLKKIFDWMCGKSEPRNPATLHAVAHDLMQAGDFTSAERLLFEMLDDTKGLVEASLSGQVYVDIASCRLQMGMYEDGVNLLREGLDRFNHNQAILGAFIRSTISFTPEDDLQIYWLDWRNSFSTKCSDDFFQHHVKFLGLSSEGR